jgi:hypothetical protein
MRIYARIHAYARLIERDTEQMVADLKDKQIEIIALMNSWVFSRLIAENERAGESLSRKMDTVSESEREQGMSPLVVMFLLLSVFLVRGALPSEFYAPFSEPRAYVYTALALALGTRADSFFSLTGVAERMRIQLDNCVSNIKAALAALSRAVM